MLLDLQVIQAATPSPASPTQSGGFARRAWSTDAELAALLTALGLIADEELAAIVANN